MFVDLEQACLNFNFIMLVPLVFGVIFLFLCVGSRVLREGACFVLDVIISALT